ncbi:MAG: RDD family protein [Bacillota bacterium]
MRYYGKADLFKRFLASLVDGFIGLVPGFVPHIGALLSLAYHLTKDAVAFEVTKNPAFKNRSIGKKLLGLQVVCFEGNADVDWLVSIKRNLPLAVGSFLMLTGSTDLGLRLATVLGLIEVALVLTDKGGRRLGDRLANTQVVMTEEVDTFGV